MILITKVDPHFFVFIFIIQHHLKMDSKVLLPDPKTPRVLIVLNRYRPMIGGAERQCELLCEHLSHQVQWVGLLTHRYAPELATYELINGLPVKRLGSPISSSGGVAIRFYAALAWQLIQNRQQYDLVHCHTAGLTGLWVAAICSLLSKPVLLKLTAEGELLQQVAPVQSTQHHVRALMKSGLRRLIVKLSISSTWTHIVALTQGGGDEARACGAAHVHVIPNGIDQKKYAINAERVVERSIPVRFGYAGRLTAEKGTHLLADAFDSLLAMQASVQLHFAGSGARQLQSSEEKIRVLINHWPEAIQHVGTVTDTVNFLSQLDVYISASTYEGLPNSVLEALASGLPCVLSNIDAHREMAVLNPDASIYFFEPNDLNSLVEAVAHFVTIRAFPRSRLSPQLYIKNITQKYLELYVKMIKKKLAEIVK